ncbi:carboxypeptidase regulatory-like domain-containing protein [Pedobacter sp.]|uniref:carboxypeptidase regulatory-like domain-containing protein n=1 Tax=Pedobacter sp. TaxID=1411316 RepID=UPI003D7F3B19
MKFFKIAAFILLPIALFAFKTQYSGAIQGKISPINGFQQVLVISGVDTLTVQATNGSFNVAHLRPRTYKIWIKAIPPLRDSVLNEVAVIDSATTDIGQIQLQQR